jgi:acyl carrier protein
MVLESKFNIEVDDNKEAEFVNSVQNAVEFVRRKQGS